MNTQLVESLIQTILSLPLEERQLFEQRLKEIESPEIASSPAKPKAVDWKKHPFFGMWKDREDMKDSTEWVRNLRRTEWERNYE
ncbi:hypothetical protein [Lyngbya confervoides]|uniref:DUF2281 domain-containing protein n=1 Tax=Lyngbya confervoides BDU141951 TaxID=1574623 RepID=A0ABD4T7L1_9CYAN|nr:hypothetical protein [Lyngbya confervoides]MCM1984759.1 hypothetical protein [Lyngbya confervoides BDU141951]